MKDNISGLGSYTGAVEDFKKIFGVNETDSSLNHVSSILGRFAKIPYENLSKILKLNSEMGGNPYRFPDEIIDDYHRFRLGGTCFSLTFFLKSILDYYGYKTYIVMANMGTVKDSHCALVLKYNSETYLLDPGYLLHRPLLMSDPINNDVNQKNPSGLLLNKEQGLYSLWTMQGAKSKMRYSFNDTPTAIGRFVELWGRSFHWRTMHGICLSRRDKEGFCYLHNHYLKREGTAKSEKGNFSEDIGTVVNRVFGIPVDIVEKTERALKENLFADKESGYRVPKWVK